MNHNCTEPEMLSPLPPISVVPNAWCQDRSEKGAAASRAERASLGCSTPVVNSCVLYDDATIITN